MDADSVKSDNVQPDDDNQLINKSKISEAQKKAQKKYEESHIDKIRANKRNYYYRQKELKKKAIQEAELLRKQLEDLKAQMALLQS
jgi:hypothetical protein